MESFKDKQGLEWTPIPAAPALIDGCEACNIKLGDLLAFDINVGSMIRMLWYTCRYQAKTRGIKNDEFFERLGPAETMDAVRVLVSSFGDAFPGKEDILANMKGGGETEDDTPFAPGDSKTSTNSQPLQESVQEKE